VPVHTRERNGKYSASENGRVVGRGGGAVLTDLKDFAGKKKGAHSPFSKSVGGTRRHVKKKPRVLTRGNYLGKRGAERPGSRLGEIGGTKGGLFVKTQSSEEEKRGSKKGVTYIRSNRGKAKKEARKLRNSKKKKKKKKKRKVHKRAGTHTSSAKAQVTREKTSSR